MESDPSIPSDGIRLRFSKLAGTAFFLAPLLVMGIVGIILLLATIKWRSGWDGFGQLIFFAVWGQVALFGGSLAAVISIVLGCVAQRKIRKQPDKLKGLRQARLAVIISATSLLVVWGGIGTVVAVQNVHEAPHRAAVADISAAFQPVVQYARENDTFPDTLEQVVSSETAGRYIYLGRGLSSAYSDYRTTGSQSIVVMYATDTVDGLVAAICANGMTHEWTKPTLEIALRDSETQRNSDRIGAHQAEQVGAPNP